MGYYMGDYMGDRKQIIGEYGQIIGEYGRTTVRPYK
jgi:hypothetical protein